MVKEIVRKEQTLVLVKASPNVTQDDRELVCCAGVTANYEWRRQYPVRYRRLDKGFFRWNWIEYEFHTPPRDARAESRFVHEESIRVVGKMPAKDRVDFLNRMVLPSMDFAASKKQSLALIRPVDPKFSHKEKTAEEIANEKAGYERVSRQASFLDDDLKSLEPCPYKFRFKFKTEDGKVHNHECLDWETPATYWKFSNQGKNPEKGIDRLYSEFGNRYLEAGVVFAFGTHSKRANQWLLVGVIRLDETAQIPLF